MRSLKTALLLSIFSGFLLSGTALAAPDIPSKGTYLAVLKDDVTYETVDEGPELLDPNNKYVMGVISDPYTVGYLKSITEKLLAGWPYTRPRLDVYIQPSSQFNSDATAGGALVFTTGMLDFLATHPDFQSEDCLAFVVAHELAHVLLNHPTDIRHSKSAMNRTNGALQVMATVARVAKSVNQQASLAYLADTGLVDMTQEYVFPIWQRDQEVQADTLAIDLMAKAGYSVDKALTVLEIFKQQEQAAHDKQLEADHNFFKNVGEMADPVNGFIQQGLGWIGRNVKNGINDLADTHPSGAKRLKKARSYINREYDDQDAQITQAPFQKFISNPAYQHLIADVGVLNTVQTQELAQKTDPSHAASAKEELMELKTLRSPAAINSQYAFYLKMAASVAEGQGAKYVPLLKKAYDRPDVTEDIAKLYAASLAQRKQYPQALATYEDIQTRFHDDEMYAYRIKVTKEQDSKAGTAGLMVRCLATGDDDVKTLCSAAQDGKL
ncbi:M48 family metallopeptidase [Acetobacter cerevisiae]|uniref:Peptidase M48 domain-containing protein n=1 Tax=Acetobacter cerevisiae TaxID=178900 RepID=A0A149Q3A1_9PROT|nr:M48 family metallopeptidase [Acetobacter cerevisiae]KXU91647.1 hypothetical protein AD928_12985 [Acetobacter cerevisiae]GBQ06358.1 hypothetical protein AA14362_0828 [Acetobacter cerevisiae DSM 14362]